MTRRLAGALAAAMLLVPVAGLAAQEPRLPSPSGDPLRLDLSRDPVLGIARSVADPAAFRATISAALARSPQRSEAEALRDEAEAAQGEAYSRYFPTVDLQLTNFQTIARDFSNDPQNIIERSRARQRTDAIANVSVTLLDFGATAARFDAAAARVDAALAGIDDASDRTALRAISAWYNVFAYRALVALSGGFVASQGELRAAIAERVAQGVAAEGDIARAESYGAAAETRLARYRRLLESAEAQYRELVGTRPPAEIARAPDIALPALTQESVEAAALDLPQVRIAEAQARAAEREATAARRDRLPQLTAGIDAGRYGVFETERDFDIRARFTLRQRFFGGIDQRAEGAAARARAADARAASVREEARRDASIAFSDISSLDTQVRAQEANYIAARRSRDVLAERFRLARGSLFDLLAAEDTLFETATAYLLAVSERDTARYVILSRTGTLVEALALPAPEPLTAR